MTRTAVLLAITVASSLVIQSLAQGVNVSCVFTHPLASDETSYSFLVMDSELPSASPRLYLVSWRYSRLHRCTWSDHQAEVQSYTSLCRESTHSFSKWLDDNVNITSIIRSEGVCQRAGKLQARRLRGHSTTLPQVVGGGSGVRSPARVKRGFIFPGTLWCGSGNKALSQENLGIFSETDKCCREHDQCKHTIMSLHIKFGIFNSNIFTMSHCDCDNKFHSCLEQAQDSISDMVGYTFFNVLKMHCFTFANRLQCARRNWFGMCKETKMFLYAEVHPPKLYNSSNPEQRNSTGWLVNTSKAAEKLPNGTTQPQLFSVAATGGYRLPALPSIGPNSNTSNHGFTNTAHGQGSPEGMKIDRINVSSHLEEMQRSCAIYKDLDECTAKILPQQRRYGFHNTKAQTLYHCNCTTRLFQTLADETQLSEVQALMLGHIATLCFMPLNCTGGANCVADLRNAPLPELDRKKETHMEQQPHLEMQTVKLRGPSFNAANRNQRALKLRKLCLRIVRSKLRDSNVQK